MGTQAEV